MEDCVAGNTARHRAWGTRGGAQGRGAALTIAGEAIPMQLIALVAATQEGPVGIEAALLTWSPHVTFVHIWGFREKKTGGVKAKEPPRAPALPRLGGKRAPAPRPAPPPGTQEPGLAQPHLRRSGCWAPAGSPARTGSGRSRAG